MASIAVLGQRASAAVTGRGEMSLRGAFFGAKHRPAKQSPRLPGDRPTPLLMSNKKYSVVYSFPHFASLVRNICYSSAACGSIRRANSQDKVSSGINCVPGMAASTTVTPRSGFSPR